MTAEEQANIDWSLTTWKGSRLQQHREFYALPLRQKLEDGRLEDYGGHPDPAGDRRGGAQGGEVADRLNAEALQPPRGRRPDALSRPTGRGCREGQRGEGGTDLGR